jgi:hypothetical protein
MQRPARRRRALWVSLAVLAALAGVVLVVVLVRPRDVGEGPVVAGGGRDISAQPIDVGVDYSFGYILKNFTKQPAVVERVRVMGVTGPIEVVGLMARLRAPSGGSYPTAFTMAFGFPPPEFLPAKPFAEEHVVPVPAPYGPEDEPYEGLLLMVGVRATGLGAGGIRGIEYTYRIGSRRYRNFYDGSGYLCAPRAEYRSGGAKDGQCPGEAVEDRFDKRFVEFRVPAKRESSARSS